MLTTRRLPYRRPYQLIVPTWISDTGDVDETNIRNNFKSLPENTLLYIERAPRPEQTMFTYIFIMGFVRGPIHVTTDGYARFNIDPIRVDRGSIDGRNLEGNLISIDSQVDDVSLHPLILEQFNALDPPPGVTIPAPRHLLPLSGSSSDSSEQTNSPPRPVGINREQSNATSATTVPLPRNVTRSDISSVDSYNSADSNTDVGEFLDNSLHNEYSNIGRGIGRVAIKKTKKSNGKKTKRSNGKKPKRSNGKKTKRITIKNKIKRNKSSNKRKKKRP